MKTQTHGKRKDTCSTPREVEALGWHGPLVTEGAVLRALHGSSAIDPPAAVHTVVCNPYYQLPTDPRRKEQIKGAGCRSFVAWVSQARAKSFVAAAAGLKCIFGHTGLGLALAGGTKPNSFKAEPPPPGHRR